MFCNHCKKEQETITVAGKTYCAGCSTVLKEKEDSGQTTKQTPPKHKMPDLSPVENEIRTEKPTSKVEVSKEAESIAKDISLPTQNLDELGESAVLLDILKDNADKLLDEETIQKDDDLEKASEEVLDLISEDNPKTSASKVAPAGRSLNDITTKKIRLKEGRLDKVSHSSNIKDAVEKEIEEIKKPLEDEAGMTCEYDIILIFGGLLALLFLIVGIFLLFG